MISIGVYVTSRYRNYPELKATMDEALLRYSPNGKVNAIVTGSSNGNSSGNGLIRRYAFENGIPCRVFETEWSKHNPRKPGKKNDAGVRSNAMIIKNSTSCILFFTPTSVAKWWVKELGFNLSGGCYSFWKMCGKMGREVMPIQVDIYKSFDNTEVQPTVRDTSDDMNAEMQSQQGNYSDYQNTDYSTMSQGDYSAAPSMPSPSIQYSPSTTASASASEPTADNMFGPNAENGVDLDVDIDGNGTPDVTVNSRNMVPSQTAQVQQTQQQQGTDNIQSTSELQQSSVTQTQNQNTAIQSPQTTQNTAIQSPQTTQNTTVQNTEQQNLGNTQSETNKAEV